MWVKICGIASHEDLDAVLPAMPDAVGLNFFTGSRRFVPVELAAELVNRLPREIRPVGVFVNHSIDTICEICDRCGLQTVQLHGDEPAEFLQTLHETAPQLRLIRAGRLDAAHPDRFAKTVAQCLQRSIELNAVLVDAHVPGHFGGTGQTAPWHLLRDAAWRSACPPLILAGGLRPENVAEAIRQVVPWGVDTASGVEAPSGRKDPDLVLEFVRRARKAFAEVETS